MPKTHKHFPKTPPAPKPAKKKRPPKPMSTTTAWSIGAVALAAGAGIAAFLSRGRISALLSKTSEEGHVPTDLLDPNRNADDRAVADFRPDMSAPMTAAEREALRPATGPAPSLVSDRGAMNSQTGAAN